MDAISSLELYAAHDRAAAASSPPPWALHFSHTCLLFACSSKECLLCRNNPQKRCTPGLDFNSCYIQKQSLRAKCNGGITIQLQAQQAAQPQLLPDVKLQIFVVDGSPYCRSKENTPDSFLESTKELLVSDQGQHLLGSDASHQSDHQGRILVDLTNGACQLPDMHINMKTDAFRVSGRTFVSFRLVARAVTVAADGRVEPLPGVVPAVSSEFVVKSARAVHEFYKPDYLYYKDSITKLKYIGGATATCLFRIQEHIRELPFGGIRTVEQLMQLVNLADRHSALKVKLVELMKLKGIQKQKWDYLRAFLANKVVYDDDFHRAFFTEASPDRGLLFMCHRGQVNMQKPLGFVKRVTEGEKTVLQVQSMTGQLELLQSWSARAQEAWAKDGHPGWIVVTEMMELSNSSMLPRPLVSGTPPRDEEAAMIQRQEGPAFSPVHEVVSRCDTHPFLRQGDSQFASQYNALSNVGSLRLPSCQVMSWGDAGTNSLTLHSPDALAPSPFQRASSPGNPSPTASAIVSPFQRRFDTSLMSSLSAQPLLEPDLSSGSSFNIPAFSSSASFNIPQRTLQRQGSSSSGMTAAKHRAIAAASSLAPQQPLLKISHRPMSVSMLHAASMLGDTAAAALGEGSSPRSPFAAAAQRHLRASFSSRSKDDPMDAQAGDTQNLATMAMSIAPAWGQADAGPAEAAGSGAHPPSRTAWEMMQSDSHAPMTLRQLQQSGLLPAAGPEGQPASVSEPQGNLMTSPAAPVHPTGLGAPVHSSSFCAPAVHRSSLGAPVHSASFGAPAVHRASLGASTDHRSFETCMHGMLLGRPSDSSVHSMFATRPDRPSFGSSSYSMTGTAGRAERASGGTSATAVSAYSQPRLSAPDPTGHAPFTMSPSRSDSWQMLLDSMDCAGSPEHGLC